MVSIRKLLVWSGIGTVAGAGVVTLLIARAVEPDGIECTSAMEPAVAIRDCGRSITNSSGAYPGDFEVRGLAYLKTGAHDKAIVDFDRAISMQSRAPYAYRGRGWAHFHKGNYKRALHDLTEAIDQMGGWAEAYHNRAMVYRKLGNNELARADLVEAVALERGLSDELEQLQEAIPTGRPSSPTAQQASTESTCALDGAASGQIAACTKIIEQGDRSNRELAEVHVYRGLAHARRRNKKAAIKDYSAAIELDPASTKAFYWRGYMHFTEGRHEQAIADLGEAIRGGDERALVYAGRGWAHYKKGDYDEAIRDFDKAIALDPKAADAYNGRGRTYGKMKEKNRALADLDKAVELDTFNALSRAELLRELGAPSEPKVGGGGSAHQKTREAGHAQNAEKAQLTTDSLADCKHEDAKRQIRGCTELIDNHASEPTVSEFYARRGIAYGNIGKLDRAIADLTKSIDLTPSSGQSHLNRGVAYAKKGDLKNAIADFDKAVEMDPKSVEALYYRGTVHQSNGNRQHALNDFRAALKIAPEHSELKAALSELEERRSDGSRPNEAVMPVGRDEPQGTLGE